MTRLPIRSEHLRCKDGCLISILPPFRRLDRDAEDEAYIVDPPVRLRVVPEDPAVQASGLAAYWRHHNRREGDDAEYSRVPVAIVRAFVRMHGGVAEAGEEALAELKRAAALDQPDPVMGAPAAVEEAAAEAPLPPARGAGLAGRAAAQAAPRAHHRNDVGGSPALPIDELTPAVIAARRVVAGGARIGPERYAAIAALVVVTSDRYAAHPLLAEGTRLRDLLCGRVREQA